MGIAWAGAWARAAPYREMGVETQEEIRICKQLSRFPPGVYQDSWGKLTVGPMWTAFISEVGEQEETPTTPRQA